jgi:hypothetical protein
MNAVKSFSQFITEEATATTDSSASDIWSITLGWMIQFDANLKSDTLTASAGKLDQIDVVGAIKELRIFCEEKRDGHTPRALSLAAKNILEGIIPQIQKLDADSREVYLASGKSITTNRYN